MATQAFNSYEYGWADIEIYMMDKLVGGVRGVKYKVSREVEQVYGLGDRPRAHAYGNYSFEGELTLLQSELEALQEAVGAGTVLDIPAFDIVVSYAPKNGGAIKTDIIKSAVFTEVEKGLKQGDKYQEITLPFKALDIQYNA